MSQLVNKPVNIEFANNILKLKLMFWPGQTMNGINAMG